MLPAQAYADVEFVKADAMLDFVSVAGQARWACLRRAVQLVRPHGGILVLNNSQRREYR